MSEYAAGLRAAAETVREVARKLDREADAADNPLCLLLGGPAHEQRYRTGGRPTYDVPDVRVQPWNALAAPSLPLYHRYRRLDSRYDFDGVTTYVYEGPR